MFYRRVLIFAVGLCVLGILLLMCFDGGVNAEAPRPTATPRMRVPANGTNSIFLPVVMRYYAPPAPLWRFGVAKTRREFTDYESSDVTSMRFGWYTDFEANPDAPQPYGIEYSPLVRVKQWKLKDGSTWTECCVGCPYVTPYTYSVSLNASQIQSMATSRPGMLWAIGNEIERIDGGTGSCSRQDEILPELYAQAYHDLYYTIKNADPTAQAAIGGMIQFTELRKQYLERVWNAYATQYSVTMPVDVWNIHVFVLQEKSCSVYPDDCWGAGIPAGISATIGMTYTVLDNKDFAKAWELVVAMRTWMNQNGQRDKPLISNEYGVNMPAWIECPAYPDTTGCPFTPEQVRDSFMYPSFDHFLNQTDASTGYPADGNRLMQRWNWWSLDYDNGRCADGIFWEYYNGALFYSGLGPSNPPNDCPFPGKGITSLGTYWKQYVQSLPSGSTRPYAPARLPTAPQRQTISTALPTYQLATPDCPSDRRVRLQFYAPAQTSAVLEGLEGQIPNRRPHASTPTRESIVCLPASSK